MPQVILSPTWTGKQFKDSVGNLLANGKLYTYVNGSFTEQQITYATYQEVYANSETQIWGDAPNSNPIILNASGFMDTGFYLVSGLSYNFAVYDAFGNQIETVSGVS